jgi:hypothetical protein
MRPKESKAEKRRDVPANDVPVAEVVRTPPNPDQPPNPRLRQFLKLAAGGGLVASTVYTLGGGTSLFSHVLPATPSTSGTAALPWVRVSPIGQANGGSTILNGGAEFGPDTPGTTTGGLQEAIDSLRGVWGAVQFWGTIPITSRLYLYPGIALRGAGPLSAFKWGSSVIKVSIGFNNPVITCILDPNFPSNKFFPYLENFTVNAGGFTSANTVQDGIRIDGDIYDVYIHHVSTFNVGGSGLNITTNSPYLKAWVDDVYFEVSGQSGITQNAGTLRVNNAYLYDNALWGLDDSGGGLLQMGPGTEVWNNGQGAAAGKGGGIRIQSAGTGCILDGLTFQDNSSGANNPTVLLSSLGSQNAYAIIKNCKFWDTNPANRAAGTPVVNHIGVGSAPVRFLIEGNTFMGQTGKAILIPYNAGNNGAIRNCPGYTDLLGFITPNPVVGASPWTYTNQDYVDLDFDFSTSGGDTITSITKFGQPLPLLSATDSGLIPVHPMESLVITYAHALGTQTAKRWGH